MEEDSKAPEPSVPDFDVAATPEASAEKPVEQPSHNKEEADKK